jgi:cytochrome b561
MLYHVHLKKIAVVSQTIGNETIHCQWSTKAFSCFHSSLYLCMAILIIIGWRTARSGLIVCVSTSIEIAAGHISS